MPLVTPSHMQGAGYEQQRDLLDNFAIRLLISFTLREDSSCIDVGAHQGDVLKEMLRVAPKGRHIAYEPLPHLARALAGAFPQVDVRNAALSDRRGETQFKFVRTAPAYSGLRERSNLEGHDVTTIDVRLEDLDSSLPAGFAPDLIKIDVEGAEEQVIRGGLRTICEHRPIVVFEHGQGGADRYGTTPEAMWDLLAGEAKLRLLDLDGNVYPSRERFAESFWRGERWQYVARP